MAAAHRPTAVVGKIICFHCRRGDCVGGCARRGARRASARLALACACVGGACVAGSVLGVVLALLFGG
jgi:hypothetical protein